MKFQLTALLVCVICLSGFAQESFSLPEAVDYALENHLDLKSQELKKIDADAQVSEYLASGMPKVSAGANYQYFLAIPSQILPDFLSPVVDSRLAFHTLIDPTQIGPGSGVGLPVQFGTKHNVSGSLDFNSMLFNLSFIHGLKAVKAASQLTTAQERQINYNIRSNVTTTYQAVLITMENKELVNQNIENLEATIKETKILYEAGFVEKLDVDRLELSLENLKLEVEKLSGAINLSKNVLKFQMNYPIKQEITLSEDLENLNTILAVDDLAIYKELDFANRPEEEVFEKALMLNEINKASINSTKYPSLNVFGNYSQNLQRNELFNGDENEWLPSSLVGLNLNIPIYDGGLRKAQMQRAQIQYDNLEIDREKFRYGLQLQMENIKVNYENAKSIAINAEKSLKLSQEIYRVAQVKYREGVGSSLELTQAETEIYAAQTKYINALFDVLNARTELLKTLGIL